MSARITTKPMRAEGGSRGLLAALVLAVASIGVLGGCDHVTEPDGPRLVDIFGPFAILEPVEASVDAVDFPSGGSVAFTARFSKQVNWVLEITGQESGAVKRIEGFSAELDGDVARWRGGTTELPFFKDEAVEAALFVPSENSDTTRTTFAVAAPRDYPGSVVADFETSEGITVFNPEFEFAEAGVTSDLVAGQGDSFLYLRGTDAPQTNFFVGLVTIVPPGGGTFEVPTTIADELYFNALLRGFGTPNTIAVVEVVVDANGTGTFEDGRDTIIPLGGDVEFPNLGVVDFEGWELYSEVATSFGAFGQGLTDAQTQEIVAVRVVLISDVDGQPRPPLEVEYGIDYLTFTAGGPLEL